MKKRGQSTIEYIMTYGWALLIIIIALGTMYALGVFSPQTASPVTITDVPAPIRIDDMRIASTGITISAKINPSFTGQITNIIANGQTCSALGGVLTNPALAEASTITTCTRSGMFNKGSKVTGQITIAYTKLDGGTSHTITGKFSGKVE